MIPIPDASYPQLEDRHYLFTFLKVFDFNSPIPVTDPSPCRCAMADCDACSSAFHMLCYERVTHLTSALASDPAVTTFRSSSWKLSILPCFSIETLANSYKYAVGRAGLDSNSWFGIIDLEIQISSSGVESFTTLFHLFTNSSESMGEATFEKISGYSQPHPKIFTQYVSQTGTFISRFGTGIPTLSINGRFYFKQVKLRRKPVISDSGLALVGRLLSRTNNFERLVEIEPNARNLDVHGR